jgi:hypothetical protein
MQIKPYRYSPLPIERYRITGLPTCEAHEVSRLPDKESTAVWNLFWLSVPALDVLTTCGTHADWYKNYFPVEGALKVITADAIADEALFLSLQLHPTRFTQFFAHEQHAIFDCYEVLGGDKWVETVLSRAAAAAVRMASEVPELSRSNVYSFNRKKA